MLKEMLALTCFDMAALPILIVAFVSTIYRKMTAGRSNVLYLFVLITSFFTALLEIIEYAAYSVGYPLAENRIVIAKICDYLYFAIRNGTNVLCLFFVFSMTRTWYRIKKTYMKAMIILPYIAVLGLLATNEKTGFVFRVTENGYERGSLIIAVYLLAFIYVVVGTSYLCLVRKTLDKAAFLSLMSIYILNMMAIVAQLFIKDLHIEAFAMGLTFLFILLFVQRPEQRIDMNTGLPGYLAFCDELRKIKITGQNVAVVIITIRNASEMSRYLDDEAYIDYVRLIAEETLKFTRKEGLSCELYYEYPGSFYVIMDDVDYNPVQAIPDIKENIRKLSVDILRTGARPDTRIATVIFPKEISEPDELFRFGHNFLRFADVDKVFTRAEKIIGVREYQIETHMDEVLERAIDKKSLKISYRPIFSVKENKFSSAECVLESDDEVFGMIDEKLLSEAAGARGLTLKLEDYVLEQVFAHLGSEAFKESGFDVVHIPISVTMCMQMDFTDRIWRLRERFDIHPEQICFCIKESEYENMSSVFEENLLKLSVQGYAIAVDGYGKGYSNILHISELPIKLVRLDESLVAGIKTRVGKAVLEGSIGMIKNIPLSVMASGADDLFVTEMLINAGCDLIQGKYCDDKYEAV